MIAYRIAQASDAQKLRALIESGYRGESARQGWTNEADLLDGNRTTPEEVAAMIAAPEKRVLLAEQDGTLIGTVTVTDLGDGRAYMGLLCVSPTLQAGGLGSALLSEGEGLAVREFGARVVEGMVLHVRTDLIAYYERRGYSRTGELRPFPLPMDVPYKMVVLERSIS
ncbi:GCN5 family acetyltransferase [Novosphingobium fuchskuhlense]|uniref:GCN5 family acetyltransferase n=1 Tax=Novosphingobium fuchskuhlense TaxID=1117702 RepID=A0A117UTH0_9SPHN|nr:GNAT family N-acetyltransferase [Novosphingobium fuchskuhlense]KUR70544.1 GCN5 family acetyltransferase [Novosphingobium fuchskuhlense]